MLELSCFKTKEIFNINKSILSSRFESKPRGCKDTSSESEDDMQLISGQTAQNNKQLKKLLEH